MNDNWDKAIAFVLAHEGGLVDDKNDPGGLTNHGISQRAYKDLDIRNLTVDQAKEIYRRDYWDKTGCNDLPWPLDIVVFDTSVNMGRGRASIFLNSAPGRDWKDYLLQRIAFYAQLPGAKFYLRGWINRVTDLWKLIKTEG